MATIELNSNPTQAYISKYRTLENGVIVHKSNFCMSTIVGYTAWEPETNHDIFGSHSEITHEDAYGWLGNITSRRLTPELDALPAYTDERINAVRAYHAGLKKEAEAYIREAYPEDFKVSAVA